MGHSDLATLLFTARIVGALGGLLVIARILIDLGFYRSGIGAVAIPAAIIMDLVGWLTFAVVLSVVDRHAAGPGSVAE